MGTLYERITALCKERGITGGKLCTDLQMSKGTLTDLKMGRQKSLSAEKAQKIASYFGVSVGYLLGEEDIKKEQPSDYEGLSENRKALIEFALSLSEDKAEKFLRLLKSIEEVDL